MVGGGPGLFRIAPTLEHFIHAGVQGLVIYRWRQILRHIKNLEGKVFFAMQQFNALVRVGNHRDGLPPQCITRLPASLENVALPFE